MKLYVDQNEKHVEQSFIHEKDISVVSVNNNQLNNYNPLYYLDAVSQIINKIDADISIFGHTYQTRDWVPRLSAKLNIPFISDCLEFNYTDKLSLMRPIFQAKLIQKLSEVQLTKPVSKKYINTSAKKIKNYLTIKSWKKKGLVDIEQINDKYMAALVIPDLAVLEGNIDSPAFLVFENYEKVLKWNRSLRFGITVCTLANMIKNEI